MNQLACVRVFFVVLCSVQFLDFRVMLDLTTCQLRSKKSCSRHNRLQCRRVHLVFPCGLLAFFLFLSRSLYYSYITWSHISII